MAIEPKSRVERQAVSVLKLYCRRSIEGAADRAKKCGCRRCKAEPKQVQEWIDTPPEKKE